jgi:hypothetical protein
MADNLVSMRIEAAETFVSMILVLVILIVVIVPPMTRSPDKLILAPVKVLADTRVELTVLNVPDVAKILPVVILATFNVEIVAFVRLIFPIVALSDLNAAVEILVVARSVAVVSPEDNLSELILELVITALVLVILVVESAPVLTLVLDSKLPTVKFVNTILVLLILVVLRLVIVELDANRLLVDTFNATLTFVAVMSPVRLNVPPVAFKK